MQEGLTVVDDYSFSNYSFVGDLEMPLTLKYVGEAAFSGCEFGGTYIFEESNIEYIGNYAFYDLDLIVICFIHVTYFSLGLLDLLGTWSFSCDLPFCRTVKIFEKHPNMYHTECVYKYRCQGCFQLCQDCCNNGPLMVGVQISGVWGNREY